MRKMNKCLTVIGVFLVLLVGCKAPPTAPQPFSLGEKEACLPLAEIDTLLWQRPDSAFALIRRFAASPEADSLDEFNTHYFHLLLAELLYKNDCAQSNRPNVIKAVDYYDGHCGPDPQSPSHRGDIAFLSARAHYINGVGYYESDSVVEACGQYLKALEVMEDNYTEKELVGKKAKFMVYTYSRLMEIFSSQYMMEPAIECGEQALLFCANEPTPSLGATRILYQIGKQYDEMNDLGMALQYYNKALEGMTSSDGRLYRDIASSKALCEYRAGAGVERPMKELRRIIKLANSEEERINRFWAVGSIWFEEQSYDSAIRYFEPLYYYEEDPSYQILAADYLRKIDDSLGYEEKTGEYVESLVGNKKSEGEGKALVSRLEDTYKSYINRKQEIQAETDKKKAVKKAIRIIIPIVVVLTLALVAFAKLRSKRLLRDRQAEAEKMMDRHKEELENKEKQHQEEMEEREKRHAEAIEIERQTHRMEQAALSGRLKRSNQEVRELKDQIKQKEELSANTETAASFIEEPICRLIMERVKEGRFKSKIDCEFYKSYALDKQQLLDLRVAADRHYNQFTLRLRKTYPKLTNTDIDYCCLYLLNLTYSDVSALMQRAYHTVVERDSKIKKTIGSENPLSVVLMDIAQSDSSI